MPNLTFPWYGTVLHGTLRNEDLIPRFADILSKMPGSARDFGGLICDAWSITDYDSSDASEILCALFDALNRYAPEGFYFGAHPGDGSDFGFWAQYDESYYNDVG